jgi:hypothetical protein
MVSPGDKEYIETKLIKKGQLELESPFVELADRIQSVFGIRPLNIVYDILEHNKQPRLQIIFDSNKDITNFKADDGLFPKSSRQEIVSEAFKSLVLNNPKYTADNIYVLFSSFERTAKEEANNNVSNQRLLSLKAELNNNGIWEIRKNFSTGIFFFYTNEQVQKNENNGIKEKLKAEYFKVIKECDEFNYLKEQEFSVMLDSKENFERNYQGNWFYYYKDN